MKPFCRGPQRTAKSSTATDVRRGATKIEWLSRHSSENDAYRAYVRTELESALALIKLVDTAQHVDEFPEFEDQYEWIMLRAKFAVRLILALWKTPP